MIAAAAHIALNRNSSIPTIGASGAISGVLAVYLLFFPSARVTTLVPVFLFPWFVEIPAITYLGFWALSQIFSGVLSIGLPDDVGGVAFWAHVGGFIAGAALCWFFLKSKAAMRPLAPDEWGLEAAWRPLKTTSVTELWRNRT